MDSCKYIDMIECKLNNFFDIDKNIYVLTEKIDLFAKYSSINSFVLMSQDKVLDSYENNEYIILKSINALNSNNLESFIDFIKKCSSTLVYPNKNHKSSIINGIIVCSNSLNTATIAKINKFKYIKPHKLSLYGSTEIRLLIVDLKNNILIHSKNSPNHLKLFQCLD